MTIEQFIANLIQTAPFIIIKLFAVVLLLLHMAFSFVLLRQTKVMIRVIEAQISPVIYTVSLIHFLSSLFVLIWAVVFL